MHRDKGETMKKRFVIILFLIGLGIFLYPIVSNIYSTKVYQAVINDYTEAIDKLNSKEIDAEREKADKHNEELKDAQLDFVDPFTTEKTKKKDKGNKSYYDALNIGPALGSIEIPKINLDLPIFHGTSEKVLSRGVGHLENSSFPMGKNGTHSVLTAHRGLPSSKLFRHLDKLEEGDTFYVSVLDEKYAYEVYDVDIVLPDETTWLKMQEDENLVTLLTCEPYMINTHRLLVKGKRVPFESEKTPEIKAKMFDELSLFLGILALLCVVILFARRKTKKNEQK